MSQDIWLTSAVEEDEKLLSRFSDLPLCGVAIDSGGFIVTQHVESVGPIRCFGNHEEEEGYFIFHIFTVSGRMGQITVYPERSSLVYGKRMKVALEEILVIKRQLLEEIAALRKAATGE